MDIRKIRLYKDKTQIEMAKLLNVSLDTYQTYESGRREWPLETILKISQVLGVSINTLDNVDIMTSSELINLSETISKLSRAKLQRVLGYMNAMEMYCVNKN